MQRQIMMNHPLETSTTEKTRKIVHDEIERFVKKQNSKVRSVTFVSDRNVGLGTLYLINSLFVDDKIIGQYVLHRNEDFIYFNNNDSLFRELERVELELKNKKPFLKRMIDSATIDDLSCFIIAVIFFLSLGIFIIIKQGEINNGLLNIASIILAYYFGRATSGKP